MNNMLLPSRVINVLAALKAQGYETKFVLDQTGGNIRVDIYKDGSYKHYFILRHELQFDMLDCIYEEMCNFTNVELQNECAAVLKYLEDLKEA